MRHRLSTKLIPTLGFVWLMIHAGAADLTAKGETYADLSKETVYVEYRENHNDQYVRGYDSMNNELDRYHYFKSNFEKTLTKQGFPVEFKFSRFPVKAPEGANFVRITYLGLEAFTPLEVQMRMWVSLKEGSEETDFGVKLVRQTARALPSRISVERDLDALYTKAAQEVTKDLESTLLVLE